jgi:PBP1b-binding outer membrane lipoprotein LpoB
MKTMLLIGSAAVALVFAGCASKEPAPVTTTETKPQVTQPATTTTGPTATTTKGPQQYFVEAHHLF